jgi:hypothetical protein
MPWPCVRFWQCNGSEPFLLCAHLRTTSGAVDEALQNSIRKQPTTFQRLKTTSLKSCHSQLSRSWTTSRRQCTSSYTQRRFEGRNTGLLAEC